MKVTGIDVLLLIENVLFAYISPVVGVAVYWTVVRNPSHGLVQTALSSSMEDQSLAYV